MKAGGAKPFMDVDELKRHLPGVEAWVDAYIARPEHLYAPLDLAALPRLARCFSPEFLRGVQVAQVERIEMPPVAGMGPDFNDLVQLESIICGRSYRDRIFVLPQAVGSESTHFHELVHLLQWAEAGSSLFLLAYGAILSRVGYAHCPFEAMAFGWQGRFDKGETVAGVEDDVRRRTRELVAPFRGVLA